MEHDSDLTVPSYLLLFHNMSFTYAIVTTTIFVPKLLDSYAEDAKKHSHNVLFVVVGDKKTPPETEEYCLQLAKKSGFRVDYFSPERQEEYLSQWSKLRDHIQWNCIQRRNVGMLYAYENGCETIATIDDDNFLIDADYLGTHGIGTQMDVTEVASQTGWMNVCTLLTESHGRIFYHRGFPLEKRTEESWDEKSTTIQPVVSAGLWLGDPDIDALERLYHLTDPTEATTLAREERFSPALGTWTPFNSQNTALARRVIPAYFLSPKVGRYDDIWGSYVVKRIADHLDDRIVFGKPLVKQERNPHNYWRDLDAERYGHSLTLAFVEALSSIELRGTTYQKCYEELSEALPDNLLSGIFKEDEVEFLKGYFEGMKIWRDTFSKIEQSST